MRTLWTSGVVLSAGAAFAQTDMANPETSRPRLIAAFQMTKPEIGRWQFAEQSASLATPTLTARADCRGRPRVRWRHVRVALASAPLLSDRNTRVSVAWSAIKTRWHDEDDTRDGWSEEEVTLKVNGETRHMVRRFSQSSIAGKRLYIDVPAASVRRADGLDLFIVVGARCLAGKLESMSRIDALDIEVLP